MQRINWGKRSFFKLNAIVLISLIGLWGACGPNDSGPESLTTSKSDEVAQENTATCDVAPLKELIQKINGLDSARYNWVYKISDKPDGYEACVNEADDTADEQSNTKRYPLISASLEVEDGQALIKHFKTTITWVEWLLNMDLKAQAALDSLNCLVKDKTFQTCYEGIKEDFSFTSKKFYIAEDGTSSFQIAYYSVE